MRIFCYGTLHFHVAEAQVCKIPVHSEATEKHKSTNSSFFFCFRSFLSLAYLFFFSISPLNSWNLSRDHTEEEEEEEEEEEG
jgi:hypothetical protein